MELFGRFSVLLVVVVAAAIVRPAGAETVEEALPFIADDASYPPGIAPLFVWPERLEADADSDSDADAGDEPDERPATLPPPAPAFPDVSALLAPFPGASTVSEDVVHVTRGHAREPEVRRLLAAVRTGYARDTRVEIVVTQGEQRLLDFERTTRMGALLLDDDRTDSMWPSGAEVSSVLVLPSPIVIRTGARVGVTVEPLDARRLVADVDLHLCRVSGERVFEETAVRRVVPIVELIHLRASIPLLSGRAATVLFGDVRVVVRVTRSPATSAPRTRVIPLPGAAQRLAAAVDVRPRRLLLVWDADPVWEEEHEVARIPAAWVDAARRAGVRLVAVPPGIAVADGNEGALQRFDELLAPLRAGAAHIVQDSDTGLSLAVVEGRPFTICVGRIIPTAADASVEIREERAVSVARIDFEAEGHFVHGAWSGDQLEFVVHEREVVASQDVPQSASATPPARADVDGPLEGVRSRADTRHMRLRGVAQENSSASLTRLEDWR